MKIYNKMLVRFTWLVIICLLDKTAVQSTHNKNSTNNLLRGVKVKPKIVNGEAAALGDVPYQVAFKRPAKKFYATFCGGSIIKEKIVISAAHCFVPIKISVFKYCTGRLDKSHYQRTYAVAGNLENGVRYIGKRTPGQWKRIALIAYPLTFRFPIDDIAVVHLTKPFTFNNDVSAIPYARDYNEYIGLQCLASGYGKTGSKDLCSINLQKAYLEIMPESVCNQMLAMVGNKKFVCTVDKVTNILGGDSGGPLVCNDTGDPAEGPKGVLVGIACGASEGRGSTFTRVSAFKKYIARGKADNNIIISSNKLQYMLLLLCILFSKFNESSIVIVQV